MVEARFIAILMQTKIENVTFVKVQEKEMKDEWWEKHFDFEVEMFLRFTLVEWIVYVVLGLMIVELIWITLYALGVIK